MTVPVDAKSGLLMLYGSGWNYDKTTFSTPAGDGITSIEKIYDAFTGCVGLIHMIIYAASLKPGGTITVTVQATESGNVSYNMGGANMQLLY